MTEGKLSFLSVSMTGEKTTEGINMNPFTEEGRKFNFNRLLQGFVNVRRSRGKTTSASAKAAKVKKWRLKNKMAYKSKRKNRIVSENLHHKMR